MLCGTLAKRGYMRWWHSFTGISSETGIHRVFFIEFFIINPSLGREEPVLGQLPRNKRKKIKPSYVMIKAGAFGNGEDMPARQLHAFYPVGALKVAQSPMVLQVGDSFYREDRLSGSVEVTHDQARRRSYMCDEGYMDWDLQVHKSIACQTGRLASPLSCALKTLDTFWHGEGIKASYQGTVTLDGECYEVTPQTSYGYADKHWGRSLPASWFTLASCRLISEKTGRSLRDSAIAIDICRPRFLIFPMKKKLLVQLTYEGEDYEFHMSGMRSRSKWKTKQTAKRLGWQIVTHNRDHVLKLSGYCMKDKMLPLNYEGPDGLRPEGCLWGGGEGTGTLLLYRCTPEGTELIDTLRIENMLCMLSADKAAIHHS